MLGYADEEDRRNHQREQEEGNNSNKNRNEVSSPGIIKWRHKTTLAVLGKIHIQYDSPCKLLLNQYLA